MELYFQVYFLVSSFGVFFIYYVFVFLLFFLVFWDVIGIMMVGGIFSEIQYLYYQIFWCEVEV